jgi:hypothetical protein
MLSGDYRLNTVQGYIKSALNNSALCLLADKQRYRE